MSARLIYGDEDRLLPWAQERTATRFRRDAYTLGLEKDEALVAVVVFDGFSECDCNMHIASDGTRQWMNKSLLLAAFAYPFTQLGLQRVTGLVPSKNEAALAFDQHIGFEIEGRCRNALPDDDLIVLGLLRENCRFIPQEGR
ncbi:MAG TPA: GNAT family protein [Noviherbaspirillum sp.]|nr:GNAT family protein [Noviherbaspirillum sp.]